MTDELGAISIGLRVGLGTLDRDLAAIKKKIDPLEREHVIPFKVGRINVSEIQREIDKITRGNTKIHVSVSLPASAGRLLHRELNAQLKAAGPVTVQVKANLSRTEIMRIKREIEVAMRRTGGPVVIPVTGVGRGGGGAPPAAGGPQPATPPPTPSRGPAGARSAPVPPSAASAPTATPTRASRGRTAREAHEATAGRTRPSGPTVITTAEDTREFSPLPRDAEPERPAPTTRSSRPRRPRAAPAPPPPIADFSGLPTGPAVGVVRRSQGAPDPEALSLADTATTGPRTARYLGKKAQRAAGRTVSTDTLRRDKVHVNAPETEAEIEYAGRPTAVGLPLDEQAQYEAERRSRGVRGARRSGARERNEPVLTPLDMISRDIQSDDNEAANAAGRDAAVRKPSRRSSGPWLGSREGSSPTMRKVMDSVQFYRFDPVLKQSFMALEQGELGEARELLKGFSSKLAGADPRKRRRFFKMFRNTENVPPEMLEKHAALQGLFAEISQQEAALKVANTEAAVRAFDKPKGPVASWGETPRDEWQDLLGQQRAARKAQMDLLRGIRRRAGGGRVVGALPVFGRGLKGIRPGRDYGDVGDVVESRNKLRFQLERVALDDIKPWHPVKPELLAEYAKMLGEGSPLPPIIVGKDGKIEDGHHRFETARAAGHKDILAYRRRAGGGRVAGVNWPHDPERYAKAQSLKLRAYERYMRRGDKARELSGADRSRMGDLMLEAGELDDALGGIMGKAWRGERAGGGRVEGPIARRMRIAQAAKDAYLVGDGNKAEAFIGDSGSVGIVGKDGPEVRTFPEDGKILPYVPEWVRRMDKNAKDFTGRRASGGPVEGGGFLSFMHRGLGINSQFNPPTPAPAPLYRRPPATEYEGRLLAEPGSGLRGRKQFREGFEGERKAIAQGGLSPTGSVQRVFVVNWPAGGGLGRFVSDPAGASRAAGPSRGGGSVADPLSEIRDLLRETRPVTPKESTPETAKPAQLSAEERVDALLESRFGQSAKELRERSSARRAALSETTAFAPVRSLAPAIGQIGGTLFGRGELLKRLAAAREASGLADRATGVFLSHQGELNKLLEQQAKTEDPDAKAELAAKIEDQAAATEKAGKAAAHFNDEADKTAKHADALRLKIGTLLGNTVGIIGGTLLFGATLGVAQAAITGVTTAIGPALERMSGFTAISAKTTSALADQTKATGGAAEAAFAYTAAHAGLSESTANAIGPLLQERAAIEAGNKTLQQGLDLLHTFEEARRRGGAQGLRQTTGGILGTPILGVASTAEIIEKELNSPDVQLGSSNPEAPAAIARLRQQRADLEAKPQYRSQQGIAVIDAQLRALEGTPEILDSRLGFFNDQLERGGSALRFMAGASEDTAEAFAKVADAGGFFDIGKTARGHNNVVLVDRNGTPVDTPEAIKGALQSINDSVQAPDPALLIKQLTERIIPAARSLFAAQGQFQRQTLNPGQFALQSIAAPTPGIGDVPFGAGIVGKDPLTGKIDTAAAAAAKSYQTQVGGAVDYVNEQIAAGREQLVNLVPANLRAEFSSLLGDIEATGQQISGIQLGIQQKQVNLQVAEYNNQLRIARRSLQDAKDLQAGIGGATRDTLGGLEGQNIALQRQLQLLQFELQQRQINFRLATAGFVSPGTTPEERAARIEFAKKEAEFAQKQLDIQKQLANNQFKGVQISAGRGVEDLVAQISLLEQGRSVTLDTVAASRALDVLNKKQALLVQQAGTYIEEGVKITQAAMEAASEIQKQTGKGFQYLLSQTASAWGIFGEQAQLMLNALTRTAPKNGPNGSEFTDRRYASGIIGDTLGPTDITVGEAAGEKVAILKNPKLMPSSVLGGASGGGGFGGGGGSLVQMTVVISGNSVREDTDLASLAELVAQKVEERLHQKTSLFGLRRA